MTKKFFLLTIIVLSLAGQYCCSGSDDGSTGGEAANVNANDATLEPALARLEFPRVKGGSSVVLVHSTQDAYGVNYSVEWDCDKKSQRWSCYMMAGTNLASTVTRYTSKTDQYPFDPLLPRDKYLSKDCFGQTGFDHGHICPSADRLYSAEANRQTFFLTNMQPQYKAFNGSLQGSEAYKNEWSPWYQLEGQIRTWANARSTEALYVVKGGTIEDSQVMLNSQGAVHLLQGEMRVPKYFFVALLLKNEQGYKAIGFWMEHKGSYPKKQSLADYVVNIRTLEQMTGIDFFCNLPDDIEESRETLPAENLKRAWEL